MSMNTGTDTSCVSLPVNRQMFPLSSQNILVPVSCVTSLFPNLLTACDNHPSYFFGSVLSNARISRHVVTGHTNKTVFAYYDPDDDDRAVLPEVFVLTQHDTNNTTARVLIRELYY